MSGNGKDEGTILDRVLARRDKEKKEKDSGKVVIREEDGIVEQNRQGIMRWYLHPEIPGAAINSLIVYRYEMPPHSQTGKQHLQGNLASFAISGFGRAIINDVSYDWAEGDVIGLPALPEGMDIQFINDSDVEAHLITAEPNFMDIFGVNGGSGFEQLEDARYDLGENR